MAEGGYVAAEGGRPTEGKMLNYATRFPYQVITLILASAQGTE
jgi:hypothetical protein